MNLLTVLNFSGGQQSSALLWMVIRKELIPEEPFAVLRADPGMENSLTYEYCNRMEELCRKEGIRYVVCDGPNLYHDLVTLKYTNKTRADLPPYWTKDPETGKRGRIKQSCTAFYKIAPMDRQVRKLLKEIHGIPENRKRFSGTVTKWIGMSADETHRVSEPHQKYVRFKYPLIDLGMTKNDVSEYFKAIGEAPPPRSVCNACFANSVAFYQDMKENRPNDFEQAVQVDEAVRDLSQVGVWNEVYVLNTLKPLGDLESGREIPDTEEWSCDSGYCFT